MELWVRYYAAVLISEIDGTSPFLLKVPQDIEVIVPFHLFLTERVNNTSAKTTMCNFCYNIAASQTTFIVLILLVEV